VKIFVTVGTQLPFDRMVQTVDEWAADHDVDVFAQVGPAQYEPRHIRYRDFIDPATFEREYGQADLVVAHAGTGSVFSALQMGKPIVIMPRVAALGEHRNDHQQATAARFREIPGIHVAEDEQRLLELLGDLGGLTAPDAGFSPDAQPALLRAVSDFVNERPRARLTSRLWRTLRGVR
jgi:UDP-N-acetylglucosamine transferase subunit ALG13